MLLDQGLQNGTGHEQGGAAGVCVIVRDATRRLSALIRHLQAALAGEAPWEVAATAV
ncbi:MAG TPA: hypothetical protein VNK45_11495 [Candidatus Acidoferrales bacterium]|nr:hypothetical protein [Candidatus Acidoferrales bacterium]